MLHFHETRVAGCLYKKPTSRYNPEQNTYMLRFEIAVNESWRNKNTGNFVERTESYVGIKYNCTEAFVDYVEKHMHKGTNLMITGSNKTRKYRPDGADKDQFITEVVISDVKKIQDPKPKDQSLQASNNQMHSQPQMTSDQQSSIQSGAAGYDDFMSQVDPFENVLTPKQ